MSMNEFVLCRDCRWWGGPQEKTAEVRDCGRVARMRASFGKPDPIADQFILHTSHKGLYGVGLMTGPSFGCIHGEREDSADSTKCRP